MKARFVILFVAISLQIANTQQTSSRIRPAQYSPPPSKVIGYGNNVVRPMNFIDGNWNVVDG
jgi:hypothetical protein